jgi:hypothetical protein
MPNVQQMESIIDQLRIHDGKLFQNESVLAVYVDFKRLVLDNVLLALQMPGGLSGLMSWNEKLEQELVQSLTTSDENLQECLNEYARELKKTAKSITSGSMLKNMMTKLCSDPSVVSKQVLSLDPIKQDFVCREIFRRCLYLYLDDSVVPVPDVPDVPDGPDVDTVEALDVNVRPEDSASQILPPKSVVSLAQNVAPPMPPVPQANAQVPQNAPPASIVKSVASTFSQKKPAIRRVVIEDDATTVFSRRQ